MGNVASQLPIVSIFNDIFSSGSSNNSRPVQQIEPYPTSTPIVFSPKPDPFAVRPPPTNDTNNDQLDLIKKLNENELVFLAGGIIIIIILLNK